MRRGIEEGDFLYLLYLTCLSRPSMRSRAPHYLNACEVYC